MKKIISRLIILAFFSLFFFLSSLLLSSQKRAMLFQSLIFKIVFSEPFELLFSEFIAPDLVYTKNHIYAALGSEIVIFNAQNPKKIYPVKRIALGGFLAGILREKKTLYAISESKGLYLFDIIAPGKLKKLQSFLLPHPFMPFSGIVREGFVYLATRKGLVVIDTRNRRRPRLATHLPVGEITELALKENFLLATQSGKGLLLFDIASPEKIKVLKKIQLVSGKTKNFPLPDVENPQDVAVYKNYSYLCMGYEGLLIVSLENLGNEKKLRPVRKIKLEGFCNALDIVQNYLTIWIQPALLLFLDLKNPEYPQIVKKMQGLGIPSSSIEGKRAVFIRSQAEFSLVSIQNPLSPSFLGSYRTPPLARALAKDKNYLYLAEGSGGVKIYRVSPQRKLIFVSAIQPPGVTISLAKEKNVLYTANAFGGVSAIDCRNPEKPLLIKTFNETQQAWAIATEKEKLYVAAGSRGINIYDIQHPFQPKLLKVLPEKPLQDIPFFLRLVPKYPYLYALSFMGKGISVFKIRPPYAFLPVKENFFFSLDLETKGDFGYLASARSGVLLLSLSLPRQPHLLARYPAGGFGLRLPFPGGFPLELSAGRGYALSLARQGNFLFLADYKKGILLYKILRDGKLKKLKSFPTRGHPRDILPDGDVSYVADSEAGLAILHLKTGKIVYPGSPEEKR